MPSDPRGFPLLLGEYEWLHPARVQTVILHKVHNVQPHLIRLPFEVMDREIEPLSEGSVRVSVLSQVQIVLGHVPCLIILLLFLLSGQLDLECLTEVTTLEFRIEKDGLLQNVIQHDVALDVELTLSRRSLLNNGVVPNCSL
jgi:hypothetical protein